MKWNILALIAAVAIGCGKAPTLEKNVETTKTVTTKPQPTTKEKDENVSVSPVEKIEGETVEDKTVKKSPKKTGSKKGTSVKKANNKKVMPKKTEAEEKELNTEEKVLVLEELTEMGYQMYADDCAQCHEEDSINDDGRVRFKTLADLSEEFEGGHEGITKTMEELQILYLAISDSRNTND